MTHAPFRNIGGMVTADHGALSLAAARSLTAFYLREAAGSIEAQDLAATRLCATRALALFEAVRAATDWRRAAGWSDPDAADA